MPPAAPQLSWRETLLQHAHARRAGPAISAVIWDMGGIVYPTPFEVFDTWSASAA